MNPVQPRRFPHLAGFDALSERSMRDHYRLYEGYVAKYNELIARLRGIHERAPLGSSGDNESLKVDITFALGAIKNHELFFDMLTSASDDPAGPLADEIAQSFKSVPQYLMDLKQTALAGRGWAWTAYDLDHHYLFNYEAGATNGLPVWNAVPILAIDLYGHAYFYDFGNNRVAYIETLMKSLNWQRIGERLAQVKAKA